MGSIKCLNCRNEITTISGMECPHCKTQLSHVKIAFLSYLGPEDSLAGYQRSYKLVLLKCIFSMLRHGQRLSVHKVTEAFRNYYLARVKAGLPTDKDADSRIENIEKSTLREVWLMIQMNPLAAIQKQGFLRVVGEGLDGEFVFQKGIACFTDEEIDNLIHLLNVKLELYYRKINSQIVDLSCSSVEKQIESVDKKECPATFDEGSVHFEKVVEEFFESEKMPNHGENCAIKSVDTTVEIAQKDTPIEDLTLSNRAFNALKRAGINSLGELEKVFSDGSLANIRNIGKTVIEEIAGVLNNPVVEPKEKDYSYEWMFSADITSGIVYQEIAEVFDEGMFNSFVRHCHLTGRKQIKDLIGFKFKELLSIRGMGAKKVSAVYDILNEIEQLSTNRIDVSSSSNEAIKMLMQEKKIHIHPTNYMCSVSILRLVGVTNMTVTALKQAEYNTLGDLDGTDYQVFKRKVQYGNTNALLKVLERFENSFGEILDEIMDDCAKDKAFDVFLRRAEGRTLQSVAEEYDITRERVRQLCNNVIRKMSIPCSVVAETLMAENGGGWFRKEQLYNLVANLNYAKAMAFLFENSNDYYCIHAAELIIQKTMFPDVATHLRELASDIVGDGINIFDSVEKIEDVLDVAGFGFITSDDFLGLLIDLEYTFYGDYALKDKKSYGWLCARIVKEEYPDGISNTKEDMSRLRELTRQKYGDLDLPESDRSVYARLCEHLILRGRSKYIAPERVYTDESILSEIKNYIESSKQKDIFYSELFAEFEGLLLMMTNIDNAQFLHGVLRYHYPADYSYSRDFLSKESGEAGQSLADRLTAYINNTGFAVSKKEILCQFPGISEVVLLNTAYKFTGLLQWEYGYFNTLDNLHLTVDDVQRIDAVVYSLLEENDGYCSEAMLYTKAQVELKDIIEKSSMKNALNLFYVAQELLAEKYSFRSPHIARNGRFGVLSVIDIARSVLRSDSHIKASDYFKLARKFMWPNITASMAFSEIEKAKFR